MRLSEVMRPSSNGRSAGFAGLVGLAGLWSIWNGDTFPTEADPTGGKLYRHFDVSRNTEQSVRAGDMDRNRITAVAESSKSNNGN